MALVVEVIMINFAIHYSGMRICSFWMAIYLFFQLFQVCDHYVMLFVKILIGVASMQLPFTMLPLPIYNIISLRKWYFVLLLLVYFSLRRTKKNARLSSKVMESSILI